MYFNAEWITHATGEYKSMTDRYGNPSPYFRKTFCLAEDVERAELLATAMGVFKIYLNGSEVANDYLSPGFVDYSRKMPFVRYNITQKLQKNNAVAAVLGDGWALGHLGPPFKRTSYCDRIEFSAQIRIWYKSGAYQEINTDDTWKAADGEIRRSDLYMGEFVDKRLSLGNFSEYNYDDSAWERATLATYRQTRSLYLEEMTVPPIVVRHSFHPTLVSRQGNTLLFDVSQNISGVVNCVFRGKRGAKAVLRHGELIVDGKLYTENLRKAEATDTCILAGDGEERFRPLMTFHGFRYFEITLFGEIEIVDLVAEAMYSDLKTTGEFSTSHPIVNKIYQNALWSQRDNFLNVPTDCPQRDERLGWTADAQIFCRSAMYNMDCKVFFEKYLADVRDAQLGNGIIPAVAPVPHIGFRSYVGNGPAAGWAEAIAEIPLSHYRFYGDKRIIRDNLPALKKLLDYYEATSPGFIRRNNGKTYGDWLSVGQETNKDMLSTLYYAEAAQVAAKLGKAIGDFETERYETLYHNIKTAFRKEFIDENDRILSDTQSAYVIAYQFGITDGAFTLKNLKRKLEEDEGKLTCGFLGVRFLLPTLCEMGMSDTAYRLITGTDYPGWGYSVVNGATTIWERWDSYTVENGVHPDGMNSFNHYSFGSCTEWMYEYCLGIRPDEDAPGFEKILLKPYFDLTGKITWAKGHYDFPRGRIEVDWKREGESFTYTATVPENVPVRFAFEGMTLLSQKQSGNTHTFLLRKKNA